MYEDQIKEMKEYIKELKNIYKDNPELAKKKAKEELKRAGIIDKNGKLLPPYNGKEVNEGDCTRGSIGSYSEENER